MKDQNTQVIPYTWLRLHSEIIHCSTYYTFVTLQSLFSRGPLNMKYNHLQYYLEKNLDARERELEREAELEEKAPKMKAKSKMSKVIPYITCILKL